jgi:hypothetical protein
MELIAEFFQEARLMGNKRKVGSHEPSIPSLRKDSFVLALSFHKIAIFTPLDLGY